MARRADSSHLASDKVLTTFSATVCIIILFYLSQTNYLLFHSVAEGFSIIIAFGIFMFAWNTRRIAPNSYLQFLGIVYFCVAGLDFLHTITYKGMTILPIHSNSNAATQLWIAARYVESVSLLIAPIFIHRKLRAYLTFLIYLGVFVLCTIWIFHWKSFPICFVEGSGLTTFKVASEYIISFILLLAIYVLYRNRSKIASIVFGYMVASIALTIASEMAFTLYKDAYGTFNMIGHFLKILSFFLIYKATVETGLVKPYSLLFLNLKQNEEALRKAHDQLEQRVAERTEDLHKSERRYRSLIETSPDAIALLDVGNYIVTANQQAAELLGFSKPEDLVGRNVLEFLVDPGERDPSLRPQPNQSVHNLQFQLRKQNGEIIPAELSVAGSTEKSAGHGSIVLVARDISERRRKENRLQTYQKQLRALTEDLSLSEERERRRIAAGLHDQVGQWLAVCRMKLGGLKNEILTDEAGKDLAEIDRLIGQIIKDTRNLIFELSPPILYELGLVPALQWLGERIAREHDLFVDVSEDGAAQILPDELKFFLFEALRELLFNVIKHAQASKAEVMINWRDGGVEIIVRDDGVGCEGDVLEVGETAGFGLFHIRERLHNLGGTFAIHRNEGQGCEVSLALPIVVIPVQVEGGSLEN